MDGPGIGATYRQKFELPSTAKKLPSKKGETVSRQKLTVMLRYRRGGRKSTVKIWFTVYRQKLTVNSHTV